MGDATIPALSWSEFERVEMRVGTITAAAVNEKARKPAYRLEIDFGEFGSRTSSAQLTERYTAEELVGKQVIAVVNFPVKKIADVRSECLVLGAVYGSAVTLLTMDKAVDNGLRIA